MSLIHFGRENAYQIWYIYFEMLWFEYNIILFANMAYLFTRKFTSLRVL